jgi:hypothetical protein
MSKIVQWIVEEVENDTGSVLYKQSFQNYDEALDVYNALKLEHNESLISIQRSEKKLLLES